MAEVCALLGAIFYFRLIIELGNGPSRSQIKLKAKTSKKKCLTRIKTL